MTDAAVVTDPNWLLSTTAQSGAALVAIIGGLLVSRLVTLSAEREGLRRSRGAMLGEKTLIEQRLEAVHQQRAATSRRWFREHHLRDVIQARGEVEVASLLGWQPRGSSDEEAEHEATALVQQVKAAFALIESAYGGAEFPPEDVDALRNRGIDVPLDQEDVFSQVARQVARARRGRSPFGSIADYDTLGLAAPTGTLTYERQDALIQRETDLRAEVRLLAARIEHLDLEISKVSRPRFLRLGVGVFSYFALVGVLLPIVLMTQRPVPDSPTAHAWVAGLFASGLLGVIAYVLVTVRALLAAEGPFTPRG